MTAQPRQALRPGQHNQEVAIDYWLLLPVMLLMASGLVMVGSASIAVAEDQGVGASHYLVRHVIYLGLGLLLAASFKVIPIAFLERICRPMMLLAALVLLLVFIPGIGYSVNGSSRWIKLGIVNFQVVEATKVMVIMYMAGYLVRQNKSSLFSKNS